MIRCRINIYYCNALTFLKKQGFRLICLICISLLMISQQGCRNEYSKVADLSRNLADGLTDVPPSQVQESPSVEQKVFIDHSESIKGFVSLPTANDKNTFIRFIESMPDVLPGCKVYKYGQPSGLRGKSITISEIISAVEFDNQLRNPDSYRLEYNPDDVLFGGVFTYDQKPSFSVLVTDGVESDSQGKVNTKVVDAMCAWLNQGKLFAILKLTSNFSGRFYSERLRRMIGKVDAASRPFYAFVFSP